MSKSAKIIVAIIALIVIVGVIVIIVNKNNHKLEEYLKPEYNFFAMYSLSNSI